jgi:hypothetical protein
MTQEALKLALDALENHTAIKHPQQIHYRDKAITAIKEALAKEKTLQALHSENERLGLYKDAYAQPEQEPVGDDWTPCMKLPVVVYVRKQRLGESHVSTREGITPVKPDDLIMRGVSGEEYPIDRAIFEQTYSLNTAPPQREKNT